MRLFWTFAKQSFFTRAIYRLDFWMEVLSVFFSIYAVYFIWTTLYAQNPDSFQVSLQQMTTYAVLGMAMETVFLPWIGPHRYIADQMRYGLLEMDLMKPLDFQWHLLARHAGESLFRFVLRFFPTLLIGALFFGFHLPGNFEDAGLFLLSVLFAYFIFFSLNFLLGLLSIVTVHIESILWAYVALLRFLSGQMVPLWMFPDWLATTLSWLPFSSIYYVPISIYIGQLHGEALWHALAIQLAWALGLLLLGRLLWLRVHTKMIVQGG